MTTIEPTSIDAPTPRLRHVRRNYTANLLDGGLYIGAMAMLDASTVLPKMVQSLGGPTWMIAATPVIMMTGFLSLPIFTAHWIERMHRYKPLLLFSGIFQRLPYLIAAFALFYLAPTKPILALAAVAFVPLTSGIVGGSTLVAWQQLLVKTIPANRRASLFASRNVLAATIGFLAAYLVEFVIERYPGAQGYGRLHLYAFFALVSSYICFAMIRETGEHAPPPEEHHTLIENIRLVPAMVKSDRNLRYFLMANILSHGIFVVLPFLTIHILDVCGKPESFIGKLLMFQTVGAVCGSTVAGYIGDRFGNRVLLSVGRISMAVGISGAMFATNAWMFAGIFFIFWFGFWINHVSKMSYGLEICPKEKQSTFLAIMAIANLPAVVGFAILSTIMREFDFSFTAMAIVSTISLCASVLFLLPLHEPRLQDNIT